MICDLTHAIVSDLPVYPGDPAVSVTAVTEIETEGYVDSSIQMGSHAGTHIDAPAHMTLGGKQLKDFPVERFVNQATCLDIRDGCSVKKVAGKIPANVTAVLFYTGASDRFHKESYWHEYPVLDDATIDLLIDQGVQLVGIDTGSFDDAEGFPVHKKLLAADILLIENLTNLQSLVGKVFELTSLPLKLENDAAPVRVVANCHE